MKRAGIFAVSCALAMSTGAFAQSPPTGQTPPGGSARPGTADPGQRMPPPPGTTDRGFPTADQMEQAQKGDTQEFFKKAAIANMAEVQLGQLATTNAESPEVKQFAQMMIDQHTKALDELRQAATSSNVALPTELDKKHQKLHDKLSKLSGREFDKEYMEAMVDGHKDVAKLLEKESKPDRSRAPVGTSGTAGTPGATGTSGTATGPAEQQASSWAAKTLPVVQGHLQQAEQIKDSLKAEKNSNDNAAPTTGSPGSEPDSGSSTPPSTPPE